jgi:hypothetical protein
MTLQGSEPIDADFVYQDPDTGFWAMTFAELPVGGPYTLTVYNDAGETACVRNLFVVECGALSVSAPARTPVSGVRVSCLRSFQ